MPANTLSNMILGFAVIFGILLIYILTLIIRVRIAKKHWGKSTRTNPHNPPSVR